MRTLVERAQVASTPAVTTQPHVRGLAADAELAAQLAQVGAALARVPTLLPLEHELDALLGRVGRAPWHDANDSVRRGPVVRLSDIVRHHVGTVRDQSNLYPSSETRPVRLACGYHSKVAESRRLRNALVVNR